MTEPQSGCRGQLAFGSSESSLMGRVLTATLVGASACCACATPPLPTLSLRGLAIVHERAADGRVRSRSIDYALTAQLAFFTEAGGSADLASELTPEAQLFSESLACAEPTLCLWASAAERSTLLALGVLQ